MASGQAAIFINWTIPIGLGHVGWGYQISPDVWMYGGLETAGFYIGSGYGNNTHNIKGSFKAMIQGMKDGKRPDNTGFDGYPYHQYKIISVQNINVAGAATLVEKIRNGGYFLPGNNCMDAVFQVMKAYARGNDRVLPWPCTHPVPRMWYNAIPGKGVYIQSESATGNFLKQHGNA